MIDDSLDADITAAIAEVSNPTLAIDTTSPAVETPAPAETAAPKTEDGPARDEHGRFAKKEGEPEAAAATTDKPAAPVAAEAKPAAEQPKTSAIPAPLNWKGGGKIQWDRLPPAVQQEIAEDYTRNAPQISRLQAIDAAIGEQRSQALAATYGSVENALKSLLAMSDMASRDAGGFIRWFAQQRGINLAQIAGPGNAPDDESARQPDPYSERFAQLENRFQTWEQQQQAAQRSEAQAELDRFAKDPSHPYFNDVRAEMSALIKLGRAGSLQEAYDMSIWAHPTIRASLLEDQKRKSAEADAAAAMQARNAAVSISGSPSGAKVAVEEPSEDLEDVIRKAQARVRAS